MKRRLLCHVDSNVTGVYAARLDIDTQVAREYLRYRRLAASLERRNTNFVKVVFLSDLCQYGTTDYEFDLIDGLDVPWHEVDWLQGTLPECKNIPTFTPHYVDGPCVSITESGLYWYAFTSSWSCKIETPELPWDVVREISRGKKTLSLL